MSQVRIGETLQANDAGTAVELSYAALPGDAVAISAPPRRENMDDPGAFDQGQSECVGYSSYAGLFFGGCAGAFTGMSIAAKASVDACMIGMAVGGFAGAILCVCGTATCIYCSNSRNNRRP